MDSMIAGELDICDTKGIYCDTFDLFIVFPPAYPYCVPLIIENSEIIPRDIDLHINSKGFCCYDVDHNLTGMSKTGINLSEFIANKIYSYFANQLYKLNENKYAGAEYARHVNGVIQFYIEGLYLTKGGIVIKFLEAVLSNNGISRNDPCIFGSRIKVKSCHHKGIDSIKSLGKDKIANDLEYIKAHFDTTDSEVSQQQ
jgi:hypothetical protein